MACASSIIAVMAAVAPVPWRLPCATMKLRPAEVAPQWVPQHDTLQRGRMPAFREVAMTQILVHSLKSTH